MSFEDELKKKQAYMEEILTGYLPASEGYQKIVLEAMNYSFQGGGKRIRPLLMQETYRLMSRPGTDTDVEWVMEKLCQPFMAALEMIHTYSLVHDDLPALDNDEYRRGRKTTHMVFKEAFALLAGDGLLNFAFETAAGAFDKIWADEMNGADTDHGAAGTGRLTESMCLEYMRRVAAAIQVLGRKAGIYGMIGGQTADVLAENEKNADGDLLFFIHANKTAALIQAAMMIGGILAGAAQEEIGLLEQAALCIGLAFQIQDDILDVTGTFQELGKPIGSDAKNEKLTYVSLKGLEQAGKVVEEKSHEAIRILNSFHGKNDFLIRLVETLINRNK